MSYKTTIGLMLKTEIRYGTRYVWAQVMRREEGEGAEQFPLNCTSLDMTDLALDSLELIGRVSDYDGECARVSAEYRDIHSIDERLAVKMAKTLGKINRAFHKAEAYEAGDRMMLFAQAIGAKWVCETRERDVPFSSYRDVKWRWNTLTQGREDFRAMIRTAEAETIKAGIRNAA